MILPLLASAVGALLLVCVLSALLSDRVANTACAAIGGAGAGLALAGLLAGANAGTLVLPIGPPGVAMTLSCDALSLLFLLLLFTLGAATSLYARGAKTGEPARASALYPLFLAAMALTVMADDGWTLLFGFELMSLACWGLILLHHADAQTQDAALLYLGMAVFGAACLIPAFGLLAPAADPLDLRFAALRAAAPDGGRAVAVLALVLLGAGSKAGLVPLHVWLPPAHSAAAPHVSALMSGAMTKVALYVLIRVLFDLCGQTQPGWWGVPLLAMGAASAVLGGLRATIEPDVKALLGASTIEHVGFIAIGLGVALAARGADLAALSSLALAASLLHVLNHGCGKALLFLGAGAMQHGAGSRALARLGGLIHAMPITTGCLLAGGASLAALPPGAGFASEWLLFQSVLAAPRIGGLALQMVLAVVAAVMALAAGLAAAAMVRLIGVACLGRPRTPRAAGAVEVGRDARHAMLGLAGLSVLLGLLPGPVLGLIEPALRRLLAVGIGDRAGLASVAAQTDGAVYAAPAIALVLGACIACVVFVVRRRTQAGAVRGAAWDCGFQAPPAWLPFGDPATQYGGASFSEPLRRTLGATLLSATAVLDMPPPGDVRPAALTVTTTDPAIRLLFDPVARLRAAISAGADGMQFLTIRRTLAVMFLALVLFLAIVGWLEAA